MVTVGILGGLGNQLFQYAFGRRLALEKGADLILDYYQQIIRTDFDGENLTKVTDVFDLPVKTYIGKIRKRLINRHITSCLDRLISKVYLMNSLIIREDNYSSLKEKIEKRRNIYLIGYWQSEQYFAKVDATIRSDFKFKIEQQVSNLALYKDIISSNSVSLHIRGKDHLTTPIYSRGCDVKYYMEAIDIISRTNQKLKIFIFTDDLDNVWQNYKELLGFSEVVNLKTDFSPDALDLLLMSKCKHNVIANSSFGWWGAWLNSNPGKIVIAPKSWFIDPQYSDENIIPHSWNRI